MTKRLDIMLLSALCLLLAATVGSCAQNELDAPGSPDTAPGSKVSIKFKIHTDEARPSTRAVQFGEEDAANVAERILNPRDMRVLLFDDTGALLQTVNPAAMEYDTDSYGDGYYSVTVNFEDAYFDSFNDDDKVTFHIMVMANLKSVGGDYTSFPPSSTLVENVVQEFVMPQRWFPSAEQGIPMYGYREVNGLKSELISDGDAADLFSINLVRALCKVEVRDAVVNAVTGPDGLKYPRVTGVKMLSWRDHGYLTHPDPDAWLTISNIHPNSPTPVDVEAEYTDGVFRLYCPEAYLADMSFRVEAVLAPGEDPRSYDVSLSEFADEFDNTELVRNHIYRFKVHALNTIAELTASASEWDGQVDEYELDNIVSMEQDGFLQWRYDANNFTVRTIDYYGREEQVLSILNGTTKYATGTFHILSPAGALWRAYFIPGENGVDAFEFVDTDQNGAVIPGSASSFAEGIAGQPATIHIRGKGPADAYRHVAELVVEVRTPDGTGLFAPLTPSPRMSSRFIIYRENRF